MNKGELAVIVLVCAVLMASFALAGFTYSDKGTNIETTYSGGENIRGPINLSLVNEPVSSIMRSNFNGTVKIIDLLNKNGFAEGTDYRCTYASCIRGYKIKESISTLSLSEDSPETIGFKITSNEEIESISSIKFNVESNALPSCSRQLLIDVLDKNEAFIQSTKKASAICDEEYSGCFNYGLSNYGLSVITTNTYCENITLKPAPAYRIGARVKNSTVTAKLKMTLFDSDWHTIGECTLPKHAQDTEKLGCDVNESITKEGGYFVCINADNDNSNYKIRTEEEGQKCGTAVGGPPFNIDYEIFASPFVFDSVGKITFNGSLYSDMNGGADLLGDVQQYIQDVYNWNCSAGCVIPFKFSGIDQGLTFSNVAITYNRKTLGTFEDNTLYKLESEESKINTLHPLIIKLEHAQFSIPIGSTATKLYLYLNDAAILPKPLNISISPGFLFDISPKTVLLGPITEFQIITPASIVSSDWDFGDGSTGIFTGKVVRHRYREPSSTGYKVSVELTRSDGVKAGNTFDVAMGSMSESANNLYDEYRKRISNVSADISSFAPFIAGNIRARLNLTYMDQSLNAIKAGLNNASSDDQFKYAIQNMLAVNPPSAIKVKEEGNNIPLLIGFENMNVDHIIGISNAEISSDEEKSNLAKAIIAWIDNNYDAKITYNIIARTNDYEENKEVIATWVRIDITKKDSAEEEANQAYLIIDRPKDSLVFAGNYSEKAVGSGTYLDLSGSGTIEFIVNGEVPVSELGIYISPDITKLEGYTKAEIVKPQGFNWGRFFTWIIVLLVIAFAAYIALQEWYKRRYESHLFKNSNDLYNIVNFIYNSRKNGMADSETAKKLKGARWSGEQITYGFKKIDGKRTGMWEIPIFKFLEKRKVKQEIEKRAAQKPAQGGSTEAGPSAQPQAKPLLK